ncbi:hypothetical protein ACFQZ4_49000 [Catellatospora coxensis]
MIAFLRRKLEQDEHDVVALQALAPPGVRVTLTSTMPMIDMVRSVVDRYAEVEHLDTPDAANGGDAFEVGRAVGLGTAVRSLALIYRADLYFGDRWNPND